MSDQNKTIMKYSIVKSIYTQLEGVGLDNEEIRLSIEELNNREEDINLENYRIIAESNIDNIQEEELKNDPYILGCFNADFITSNSNLSYDIVKALQEGDQYDKLGQHLIDNDCVGDMQSEYASLDGYGHHFAHYDHNQHEICIDDTLYYVFRT